MKKSKFSTSHFRLKENSNSNKIFSTKDEAFNDLLEEFEEPMTLIEALDKIISLSIDLGYRRRMYMVDVGQNDSDSEIYDLKNYILKLKS